MFPVLGSQEQHRSYELSCLNLSCVWDRVAFVCYDLYCETSWQKLVGAYSLMEQE